MLRVPHPSGAEIGMASRVSTKVSETASLDPVVVLAADDHFAMPLAVTVRSALAHLAPDRTLHVYVIDGGLSEASKRRLSLSWPADRCRIVWLNVDVSDLAGLPISGHVNLVSYYRILISRVLPAHLDRVIYLDSDLLVCADLSRLWNQDMQGRWCLAVRDCAAPNVDASRALPNYDLCAPYLSSIHPVPNYRQLGLDPAAPYFNAGLMLVNLAAWRDNDLSREFIECLEQNRAHVRWWDQYALNVVLAGRWGALDGRWNQGSQIFAYPSWRHNPLDRHEFDRVRNDPFVVHFTGRAKPWAAAFGHPYYKTYFECLDATDWTGWRPSPLLAFSEFVRIAERRVRHGRKWLQHRVRRWKRGDSGRAAA
jgi:lipopolysaccharide biosynthesis glycosyltransferase